MALPRAGKTIRGALVALCLSAAASAAPRAEDAALVIELTAGEEAGEIVFAVRNEGTEPLSVLRTDTPLAGSLGSDAFAVWRTTPENSRAERGTYIGRIYKRGAASLDDFVELAPGEGLVTTLDLEQYYDVPHDGDYRVDFRGELHYLPPETARTTSRRAVTREARTGHVHTGPDGAPLTRAAVRARGTTIRLAPSPLAFRARPPLFESCGVTQQTALVEATGAAEGLVTEALRSLEGLAEADRAASPRYRHWFGEYTPARYETVTRGYRAIAGAVSGETLGLNCGCDERDAFAFVFPSLPYDIYLCPLFFEASLLGTDSRAGTLIHELSHFRALLGTGDFRYGQGAVASLAISDPDRAVANADSYEYFAENTPALPMSPAPMDDQADSLPADDGGPPQLSPGTIGNGSLASGESTAFRVSGAVAISLISVSGDADLFVHASPAFDEASRVCHSVNPSATSTLDRCALPDTNTYHVSVRANDATVFRLVAESVSGDTRGGTTGRTGGGGSGGAGWALLLGTGLALMARRRRATHRTGVTTDAVTLSATA